MNVTPNEPTLDRSQRLFWIAEFDHKKDNKPRPKQVSIEHLARVLTTHEVRPNKDGMLFSPTSYPGVLVRANDKVGRVSMIVADIDRSTYELLEGALRNYRHIGFTTHSHGSDKGDRWRLVFPMSRDVDAEDWTWFYPSACEFLVGDTWDHSCRDSSRMHYFPACHPDRQHLKQFIDWPGPLLDPADVPLIEVANKFTTVDYDGNAVNALKAVLDSNLADGHKHTQLRDAIFALRKLGYTKAAAKAIIRGVIYDLDPSRVPEGHKAAFQNYSFDIDKVWSEHWPDPQSSLNSRARAITFGRQSEPNSESKVRWPESLQPEALEGLAGRFVNAVAPNTEADPAGLLFSFLVAFGNAIGRTPHIPLGNGRQFSNLFTVLVGPSSSGAKGTSWDEVREVFYRADPQWTTENVVTGLSSREGLIKAFECGDEEENKRKNRLAHEPEFGNVLTNARREGNAITGALREAFDTDKFQVMTRKDPLDVKGVHLSLIAHITPADMAELWRGRDTSNGLGNRILWVCSKRSKILEWPDHTPAHVLNPIVAELQHAINFGRTVEAINPTNEGKAVYTAAVSDLVKEVAGPVADLFTRARPLVLRLAMVYATLERSAVIETRHVLSALAAWEYCKASAAWAFGVVALSTDADRVLSILKKSGPQTRTQLFDATDRHVNAGRLKDAAAELVRAGLAKEYFQAPERGTDAPPGGAPQRVLSLLRDLHDHCEEREYCEECPTDTDDERSLNSRNSLTVGGE